MASFAPLFSVAIMCTILGLVVLVSDTRDSAESYAKLCKSAASD